MYHSLSMTYRELFPILIQNYGISVLTAKLRRPLYPKEYDANARCEYHGGVIGHSIENCMAFKDKVQALIDVDPTKFKELVNWHREWWYWGSIRGNFLFYFFKFCIMKCILKGRCLKWEFAWNEYTGVASIKNRICHFAKVAKNLKKKWMNNKEIQFLKSWKDRKNEKCFD